jgi:hypothetical protein
MPVTSGWVYVIRIGAVQLEAELPDPHAATPPAGWNAACEDLCLLKIGKAEPHKLSTRLNTEALAWGKVLAPNRLDAHGVPRTKHVGDNVFPVIDTDANRPQIYIAPSGVPSQDDMTNAAAGKLEEMQGNPDVCSDVGCWLWRGDEHHINEDERFVAALMGAPLRAHLLQDLITAWNAKTFYGTNPGGSVTKVPIGELESGQFGRSEYVISTNAHFQRLRERFLQQGDFTLDDLTDAVTTGNVVLRLFPGTTVTFRVPTLPDSIFTAVHLLRVPVDLPEGATLEAVMHQLGL